MARRWKAWILEDDYNSEYRFRGQPIPASQGHAVDARVVFVGTFAKNLFPAMRLGYMVVPAQRHRQMIAALSATGQLAPLITQAALSDFINEGYLTRHLLRMRRVYAERRDNFVQHLETCLTPWMRLHRPDSGNQLVAVFRKAADDKRIAAEALPEGINVSALSLQYGGNPPEQGLLMGFAAADERTTCRAMQCLAAIIARQF